MFLSFVLSFSRKIFLAAISTTFLSLLPFSNYGQLPEGFSQSLVADGLDPIRMEMSDDGRIFIAEKNGKVRIVKDNQLLSEPFISISVDNFSERGLEGFVLDPDFGTNQFFYLYYTVPGQEHNRVSRFKASGDHANPDTEHILLELDTLFGYYHNAGAMVFGSDGKLLICTGDGGMETRAQDLNNLMGKVLRINPDGTIPTDNPFYTTASGMNRAIYALGFRNPFSISRNANTGKIIVNDVGSWKYEEINVLEAGKNYGWPLIEGPKSALPTSEEPDNYQDPLYSYLNATSGGTEGCAVIGGAFYSTELLVFPEAYHDKYFFGDYCSNYIKMLDPDTGVILETFVSSAPRPVALMSGADGAFYYFTRGGFSEITNESHSTSTDGKLWKVVYTGSSLPFIYGQPAPQSVLVNEDATFTVMAGGPGPLQFQWRKNNIDIENEINDTLKVSNVTLADDNMIYSCKVSNASGEVISDEVILHVTDNTRPVVSIVLPVDLATYEAGDTLRFKGTATDNEDGEIGIQSLQWKVDFHHNTHVHPAIPSLTGTDSSAFIIPVSGETSPNVWYRIYLTATDGHGFSQTVYKDVFPNKATITLRTEPVDLKLYLDGQPISSPHTFEGVVNMQRSLVAPPVQHGDNYLYIFQKWKGNQTANALTINVPGSDSTFTAIYSRLELNEGTGLTARLYNQTKTFNHPPDFIRLDTLINFNWGILSPEPDIIDRNNFTIRWSGYVKVPEDGLYNFYLLSDDGSRLWINNELVIDNWQSKPGVEKTGVVLLSTEKYHTIKIEYFDLDALATIKLYWSSSSIPKSLIPRNQLFITSPDNHAPVVTSSFTSDADGNIIVKATANDDADGPIDVKQYIWRAKLVHNDHAHSVQPETSGIDSLVIAADLDHSDPVFYRIYVTVYDEDGALTRDSLDVHINPILFRSNITGISGNWDDQLFALPKTNSVLEKTTHQLSVPTEFNTDDSIRYQFIRWSNGHTATELSFTATHLQATYEAIYNAVPTITFTSPDSAFHFQENSMVTVKAFATDVEDGQLQITWQVVSYQNNMDSLLLETTNNGSVQFLTQQQHAFDTSKWYRIHASVTDSNGLSVNVYKDIHPEVVRLTVNSNMDSIAIRLNATERSLPISFSTVVGATHELEAITVLPHRRNNLVFDQWKGGNPDPFLKFSVPKRDTTLTVLYDLVMGVNEMENGISFFPNPVTDYLIIDFKNVKSQAFEYEIVNSVGQQMAAPKKADGQEYIDFQNYTPGCYFIKLTQDGNTYYRKIFKF